MDKEQLIEFVTEIRQDMKWVKAKLEKSDDKYAAKWVEKLAKGFIALVLTAVVVSILSLIIK